MRWANGRVYEVLLLESSQYVYLRRPKNQQKQTYCTRSKTETLLPTGESKQVPSGLKRRFPLR